MPLFEKIAPSKNNKLELMDKVWTKVKPEDKEEEIIARLMRLVNAATNAMACSLLLYDDKRQELYFKFAQPAVQIGSLQEVINRIESFMWIIFGGVAVIAFVISGILFLTAGGQPDLIKTARRIAWVLLFFSLNKYIPSGKSLISIAVVSWSILFCLTRRPTGL